MDEQMTPMSDLGLTDPQAQQDEVLKFLQQLAQLMQQDGGQAFGGASSPSINQGPVVTQAMIDALAPDARERTGLLPHQTPAGIDVTPGVMSQLGAPLDMRSANPEWMVPQAGNDLMSILSGGGGQTPGAITSYAGGVPTTYVPETPRMQSTQRQVSSQIPSSQMQQPEGLGLTPEEYQTVIQSYLSRGEPVPAVLQGATGQAQTPASATTSKVDPAKIAKHAQIVHQLTKNGYSPTSAVQIADQVVPEVGQISKAEKQAEKLDIYGQEKRLAKSLTAAPKGLYLDKAGKPLISSPLTYGDIPEGAVHYDLNAPQGKLAASIPLLLSHVNQTVEEVNKIAPKGKGAFQNFIQAKIREWKNDPAQRALGDMLDPASAMAMGTLYSSGGTSTRGGVALAQMFKDSFYSPGNDVPAVKEKLSVALGLMKELATKQNLHPRYIQELQDLQTKVTSMGGTAKAQTFKGEPDATKMSGQVIVGNNGSRLLSDGVKWIDITNQGAQ